MHTLPETEPLSDPELLEAATEAVRQENESLAQLLVLLADIEDRDLHVARGFTSLYAFCAGYLGLRDGKAYRRIHAARLGRRFPVAIELLAQGEVSLTTLNLLSPRLDQDNHLELLRASQGCDKRQVKELLAARFPAPDPAPSGRKLPAPAARPTPADTPEPSRVDRPAASHAEPPAPTPAPAPLVLQPPARRPVVEPIADQRYSFRFAGPRSLVDKLEELEALRSHRPAEARSLERMLEDAVDLLLAQERKKRFAVGARPRKRKADSEQKTTERPRTRHIPADVRRQVYERDGGRCTYRDPQTGRRCGTRRLVTFEHRQPFARGGRHTADQITLLCASHNRHAANQAFGQAFMRERVERARGMPRTTTASGSGGAKRANQLDLLGSAMAEQHASTEARIDTSAAS